MIDYKIVYIEQIIKLYNDYVNLLQNNTQTDKENIIKRMNTLFDEIVKESENEYKIKYEEIFNIKSTNIKEEIDKLSKLEKLLSDRVERLRELINNHQIYTENDLTKKYNINELQILLDDIKIKKDSINNYISNKEEILELKKVNEDSNIELNKLNTKVKEHEKINKEMSEELSLLINKILNDNNATKIDKEDVEFHYPQYKELYLKVSKQNEDNKDNTLTSIMEMAKVNYEEYSLKNSLIKLLNIKEYNQYNYTDYIKKQEELKNIISSSLNTDTFKELTDLLNKQFDKLEKENTELQRKELLETVIKNNDIKIVQLEEFNNQPETQKLIKSLEQENPILPQEKITSLKDENPIDTVETENVKSIEVIKNPYAQTENEFITRYSNLDLITKVELAPTWLINQLEANQHKFLNWFDKLNALVKRKKYLKDE